MIVIESPQGLDRAKDWQERLANMTVAHQLIFTAISSPKLTEGKQKVTGIEAIEAFLAAYEKDVAAWNQDRCDMWFFDK